MKLQYGITGPTELHTRGLRFRLSRGRQFAGRQEGLAEGVAKVIATFKVAAGVFLLFGEEFGLDHVEDDFAEIGTGANAPFLEHGNGHWAKFGKGEIADAIEQFLAGDVLATAFLAPNFAGVVQGVADEFIGVAVVTGILGADSFESFFKTDFLHG
jgi:hypothetical protein